MLPVAPMDYERYAVLLSPLLVSDAPRAEAPPPSRQVDELDPIRATLRRFDSRADRGLPDTTFGPTRNPAVVLKGRGAVQPTSLTYAADLAWLFQLPNDVRAAIQKPPNLDPAAVANLYEREEKGTTAAVRVSG